MNAERMADIKEREQAVRFQGPFWASTKDDGPSLNNHNILWRDEAGDVWVLAQVNMYIEKEVGDTFPLRDFLAQSRSDIPYLVSRVEELEAALGEAIDAIEDWGAYVPEHFKDKHDFAGDIARLAAARDGEKDSNTLPNNLNYEDRTL